MKSSRDPELQNPLKASFGLEDEFRQKTWLKQRKVSHIGEGQ